MGDSEHDLKPGINRISLNSYMKGEKGTGLFLRIDIVPEKRGLLFMLSH